MATAVPGKESDTEVFRHQARTTHTVVRLNVEGLTQEESLIQPAGGGNCLNWVLGHLLWVYDEMLPLLGQVPAMGKKALARYARGSAPLQDPAEALDLGDLLAAWDEATQRVDAGLAGLTAAALDRPAPRNPSGNPNETIRSLLSTVFFHQAYHAGQTGLLRRTAGRKGAIP
jgi:uncharacterized damage-inducible protein DinB